MILVLANGCFDLLHPGHVRHLEEARRMGDFLVVGITMDRYVGKRGRPIHTQEERLDMVKALRCVNAASLCKDSLEALVQWKPDIFVKGPDYRKRPLLERHYCARQVIRIAFTSAKPYSTTKMIARIK